VRKQLRLAAAAIILISCLARPQNGAQGTGKIEREYPFPISAVETSLHDLGAYQGARLPTLDGFVAVDQSKLPQFERPYYEFKIEVVPVTAERTVVRLKANVSAWYQDPQGTQSGYQSFPSNGRLENDLLDRLSDYLANNRSKLITDANALTRRLAEVHLQRVNVEDRVAVLEKQLEDLRQTRRNGDHVEYVSVLKSQVAVLSAPEEHASVLLKAGAEDEFEVLEHRDAWFRVALAGGSGWVRKSQVRLVAASSPAAAQTGPASSENDAAGGYNVVHENVTEFSGEWASLKGKNALYLWARPVGASFNTSAPGRLRFAQNVFRERYREAAHSSQRNFDGVVIIFLDQGGGVAAADLTDIGLWVDGALTEPAFLKKCSLDPTAQFLPVHARVSDHHPAE